MKMYTIDLNSRLNHKMMKIVNGSLHSLDWVCCFAIAEINIAI